MPFNGGDSSLDMTERLGLEVLVALPLELSVGILMSLLGCTRWGVAGY